jgi:hypothetical protein
VESGNELPNHIFRRVQRIVPDAINANDGILALGFDERLSY